MLLKQALSVGGGDRQQIRRFEARPADQRPVDIVETEDLARVVGFHRTPVEKTEFGAVRPESRVEQLANAVVYHKDVCGCRRKAGADRPHRLIGDDDGRTRSGRGQRFSQLPDDHGGRPPGLALGSRLADADDRYEPGLQRRFRLGAHQPVGLVMQHAALGVADDDIGRAGVLEHRGGNVAGEGAARLGMAILRAQREFAPLELPGGLGEEGRRRADRKLGRPRLARVGGFAHGLDLDERRREAVHFPVAGDERANVGGHFERLRDCLRGVIIARQPLQSANQEFEKSWQAAFGDKEPIISEAADVWNAVHVWSSLRSPSCLRRALGRDADRRVDGQLWISFAMAPLAAGLLVRLFMIQHDCGHGSFLPSKAANEWIGRGIGVVTMTPYDHWRRCHAIHHATSGNLDRRGIGDIDTLTVREYFARNWRDRLRYRLYRHPLVMFGVGPFYVFVIENRLPFGFMRKGSMPWLSTMTTNAGILVAAGLLVWAAGLGSFLIVHLPIIVLGATAGVWLFYVQHQFEGTSWEPSANW